MKPSFLSWVFLCITPSMALAQKDEPANQWTPRRMMQMKRIGSVQVSPDGQRVAYSVRHAVMDKERSEYVTHIHLVNSDGSRDMQLTQGTKSCDDPQWSPSGDWLAFLSARSGKRNVWIVPAAGGEAIQLTDRKAGVSSFKWSPLGNAIALTALDAPTPAEEKASKEKNDARVVDENIKMHRLYVLPVSLPPSGIRPARLLTKNNFNVGATGRSGYDWSPDGTEIVFSHTRSPSPDDWTSADLSRVRLDTGEVRPLVHTGAAEYAPLYSPDGQWIAYVASDDPPTWAGSGRVHVIPASGGTPRILADTHDDFGRYSELVGWAADGKKIYFTELQGTALRLCALPLDGKSLEMGKTIGMIAGSVHLNGKRDRVGFSWETLDRPPEACVSAVDRFDPSPVSTVNQNHPKLPLGPTEIIRWKSVDGREIEGLLTYPAGYEKGKKYPLLLNVHGGPMGAFTQSCVAAPGPYPLAAFSGRGYAILRANIRGSSGYGKTFRYANYGDWGGKDYQDLMTGVDHVIKRGVADPDRLGVMGWSYGGYMTSWIVTQTQRFRAASVGAGVTDLVSFTGTADIPGFLPDYFGGEPWDKGDTYRTHSAMFNVKGVRTPTLIQHGERDERVPLSQGRELYNALKRQGCVVRMVIYPRMPHAIEEPRLLIDCMERNLEWFDRYVGGKK